MAPKKAPQSGAPDAPEWPDWLERVDSLRARVRLTEHDSGTILPIPFGVLLDQFERYRRMQAQFEGDDALPEGFAAEMVALVDAILTRSVERWDLRETQAAYGVPVLDGLDCPNDARDATHRDAVWKALPQRHIERLMAGVEIWSGEA